MRSTTNSLQSGLSDTAPLASARPCLSKGCPELVLEAWEETGLFCARCAIEADLFDREARWDRIVFHASVVQGTDRLSRPRV